MRPRATGARIAKDLQQANELVAPLAKMLSEQRHPSILRAHLIDMIIKAMLAYPMVEGVGVAFEPNAFDGADSLFRLSPGCASSGRYIPFLTSENGTPFIDTTLNHLVD